MPHVARINLAKDFHPRPGARTRRDGPGSGEELREMLQALLRENEKVSIDFDGLAMCAPSFLEEAFGGLAREFRRAGADPKQILSRVEIVSISRPSYAEEIRAYIDAALRR